MVSNVSATFLSSSAVPPTNDEGLCIIKNDVFAIYLLSPAINITDAADAAIPKT